MAHMLKYNLCTNLKLNTVHCVFKQLEKNHNKNTKHF